MELKYQPNDRTWPAPRHRQSPGAASDAAS